MGKLQSTVPSLVTSASGLTAGWPNLPSAQSEEMWPPGFTLIWTPNPGCGSVKVMVPDVPICPMVEPVESTARMAI